MLPLTFDEAFDRLMGHEGGYVLNPADPGGETNWGISKRSYPSVDIAALTREDAKAIYRRDFWEVLGNARPSITFQVFDFAVNSGISTALRKLQQAVGVADDGHWGPVSQAALAATDENDVLLRLLGLRLQFMAQLKTFADFGRGWTRRVAENLLLAAMDNAAQGEKGVA